MISNILYKRKKECRCGITAIFIAANKEWKTKVRTISDTEKIKMKETCYLGIKVIGRDIGHWWNGFSKWKQHCNISRNHWQKKKDYNIITYIYQF